MDTILTGTIRFKSQDRSSTSVPIRPGIAQSAPTKHLAEELGMSRRRPLERSHEIPARLADHLSPQVPPR